MAYFLDCFICYGAIMLLLQWAVLSHLRPYLGITDDWFRDSLHVETYVLLTISLPVWLYFTYFDSFKTKGAYGKRIMKLAVIDEQQERIGIGKSFLRTAMKLLPWEIAHLGVIFPVPLYFQADAGIRPLTIIGIVLFVVYSLSILIDDNQRTMYDRWLGTRVVLEGD